MSRTITISPHKINLDELFIFFREDFSIKLSEESVRSVKKSRQYLEKRMNESNELIYGVNTGFGSLCNVEINKEEVEQLQENLLVSHATGVGDIVTEKISRLILLLKIKSLAFGYSGVRIEMIEKLVEMYNKKVTPVIYEQGSLGASGDLAPLAHLGLPLIGEGRVWYEGEIYKTPDLFERLDIKSMKLAAKEGLALINGTQFSLAYAVWSSYHAKRLVQWSNIIAALSVEAFECSESPFDKDLHEIRQHRGQKEVASDIRDYIRESEVLKNATFKQVQDPYSFRCIPQVHGASLDTIYHVYSIVTNEINAVTDNPNIFYEENKILSGGNFHAQPLALVLDYMGIALAELGNISERRVFKLLSGERGLPDFLTNKSGLNSGLMIAQYTAASVVSQNKQLATPCSVDSISSSKGQEDHVSMSANAATKTWRMIENLYKVLAIELMSAVQALEFRKPNRTGEKLRPVVEDYRKVVSKLEGDRILSPDIHASIKFIKENNY